MTSSNRQAPEKGFNSITAYGCVVFFIFLYVFTPLVILPFNVMHILALVSLTYLLSKASADFFNVLASKELGCFSLLHVLLCFYCLILSFTASGDFTAFYSAVTTIIELLPCTIFISLVLIRNGFKLEDLYDLILFVGTLQVGCVALTMIFPPVRDFIIASSGNEGLQNTYDTVSVFRIYGIARNYTFAMPLFQGICVIIAIVCGFTKSAKYFYLLPLYLISIVVNARTPLISFVMPIIPLLFYNYGLLRRHRRSFFVIVLIAIVCGFGSYHIIKTKAESSSELNTWGWLYMGIDELINIKDGEAKGNLSALTDTMWFAPDGVDIVVGTGENVFGRDTLSSDVGYVVNLFYGGIIFSALLYCSYMYLITGTASDSARDKTITLAILIYLLVANLKGNVFRPNEAIQAVILLCVFKIVYRVVESRALSAAVNLPLLFIENNQHHHLGQKTQVRDVVCE